MRALFVMDPLSTVQVDQDSSYALMLEWQKRGGEVWHCLARDLWSEGVHAFARAARLDVGPRPKVANVLERRTIALKDMWAIFKRTDPPFDIDYIFCTYLLELAEPEAIVVNAPQGLRDANEKMAILAFPDLIPPTIVTRDMAAIRAFVGEQGGKGVIKPWDGNGGRGVFVLEEGDGNLGTIIESSTNDGATFVMVQSYLEEVQTTGDKRIILVDGEFAGAFARVPGKNDHRGNMHVGASVEAFEMTARDLQICEQLAPYLKEKGLLFTGIDVIGNYLTEINVTSPTGIQECSRLYGTTIEADIVDAVLEARRQR